MSFISGMISLAIGMVMFVGVFMTTYHNANTTGWTATETSVWAVLGIVGICPESSDSWQPSAGMANGIMQVFGVY